MRLIDADKLLNKIDAYMCGSQDVMFVKELIKQQPTAYDVDKVVEQLKALCNAEVDYYSSNDVIDREDALDIVKKGGLDES